MNSRLARPIMIGVALFIVAVVATMVVRGRSVPTETTDAPISAADLTITEVRVQEVSGTARWELIADQAAVYDREGRTALTNITIHVQHEDRAWTIVGMEGDLHQESRDLEIRRDVVLTADDGLRLETPVLHWQGREQRLWTDAPVRILQAGAEVRGTGLDVRLGEEVTTVMGPVRATFSRRGRR